MFFFFIFVRLVLQAIISVQSAWRAHKTRKNYVDETLMSKKKESSSFDNRDKKQEEEDETLFDDDVLLIQSAFRGHAARKRLIDEKEHMLVFFNFSSVYFLIT